MKALILAAIALNLSSAFASATCTARLSANHNSSTDAVAAKEKAKTIFAENVKPQTTREQKTNATN